MAISRIEQAGGPVWVRFADGADPRTDARVSSDSLAGLLDDPQPAEAHGGKLLAPLDSCARIVCIGLNYRAHAEESGVAVPSHPVVFFRTCESLVGPEDEMVLPAESERFDWEGELGVVIGRPGRRIPAEMAMEHVLGYCCVNDGSLRDWQKHTSQFAPGKNFDRSGAIGPWLVEADDAGEVAAMRLTTTLNGETVQDSGVDDLIFTVPEIIAYVSGFMELRTGDVIATGTPSGVGGARKPPRFMREGDEISVGISGVGTLTNRIVRG